MRRAAVCLCALLVLSTIPFTVAAQHYIPAPPPTPLFIPPTRPLPIPSPMACGPAGFPCPPKHGFVALEGSGNYQSVDSTLDTRGAALGGIQQIKHSYQVGGLVLGTTAGAEVTSCIGIRAGFSILIPFDTVDEESYTLGAPLGGAAARHWKVGNNWYLLEGTAAYRWSPEISLLAGFRWDHFSASFKDPYNTVGIAGLGSDRADLTVNGYIPFLGVQINRNGPSTIRIFRFIGFPALWGDVEYNQTVSGGAPSRIRGIGDSSGGYFLEAYGEYGLRFFNGSGASAFGKFASYQAKARLNGRRLVAGAGTVSAESLDMHVGRISWQLGVKFELPFVSPF